MTEKMDTRDKKWSKVLVTILGTFIMATAVNLVFEPMHMVVGGLSGLAIIIKNVTGAFVKGGIPVWITTAVINVPLFLAAWKILGANFVKRTLLATVSFTVALSIIPSYNIANADYLLASLFGGVLTGAGLGLVFRNGGATGGTDLLGAILHHFFPNYSVSKLLLVIDSTIVLLGAYLFGLNQALYAVIAAYITSRMMSSILEGVSFAKLAYIICDDPAVMAKEVMEHVGRGTTFIQAEGGYTQQERRMIMCVVSPKQIAKLKETVARVDNDAFLIISDVREVFGEGFIENDY